MGVEVREKALGIIGLGRVGAEVARRALGLGMRLLAHDPFVAPERAAHLGVEIVGFTELLARSDFLTLHTPLTDSTRSILGAEELAQVKPGIRIINVARGGLIDDDALLEALENGAGRRRRAGRVRARAAAGERPAVAPPGHHDTAPGGVHGGGAVGRVAGGGGAGAGGAAGSAGAVHGERALRRRRGARAGGVLSAGGRRRGPGWQSSCWTASSRPSRSGTRARLGRATPGGCGRRR